MTKLYNNPLIINLNSKAQLQILLQSAEFTDSTPLFHTFTGFVIVVATLAAHQKALTRLPENSNSSAVKVRNKSKVLKVVFGCVVLPVTNL